MDSPFVTSLHCCFQDEENLYFLSDFMEGGDLVCIFWEFWNDGEKFVPEQLAKFYIASIILGLEAIHKKGIMHKDIKSRNVLIDKHGYLKICDFGLSEHVDDDKHYYVGTPGYTAPELLLKKKHGVEVDYYSLGILSLEIWTNNLPGGITNMA